MVTRIQKPTSAYRIISSSKPTSKEARANRFGEDAVMRCPSAAMKKAPLENEAKVFRG
jgi:hypothetical protein